MLLIGWIALALFWLAWAYPYIFRAPHIQRRPSITLAGPTRAGLLLECLAILIAFVFRLPPGHPPGIPLRRGHGVRPHCRGAPLVCRCASWQAVPLQRRAL